MTRSEQTFKRENYFSLWMRNNLPNSNTGYMVSDIDVVLYDFSLKKVMMLEVKTRGVDIPTWQRKMFNNIHRWIQNGIDMEWQYLGFHSLKFDNTNFNDGKVYFDNKEIEELELMKKLSFGKYKETTLDERIRDAVDNMVI